MTIDAQAEIENGQLVVRMPVPVAGQLPDDESDRIDDALSDICDAVKLNIARAVADSERRMTKVLRVHYRTAHTNSLQPSLPTPRLQFRWEDLGNGADYFCHYEMVFGLDRLDIRNDDKQNVCVIELGRTKVGGGRMEHFRTPFRDGAHAQWDGKQFGGLPIYVISPDGSARAVTGND